MEGSNSQKNKLLPPESICVSCIATVGLVSMNIVESQTNQQINSIIPSKDVYRYFLYLYMKASYDELHAMASGGTATLNLNTGSFSKTEVIKQVIICFFENYFLPLLKYLLCEKYMYFRAYLVFL
jgi:type I restriction enzyme S subunit